jgi:hypothetical protein
MNITNFSDGLCITYTSSTTIKIAIASTSTDMTGIAYEYNLPYTTSSRTVELPWSYFTQPDYAENEGAVVARSTALANAYAIHIMYTNDQSKVTDYCGSYSISTCESYAESYGSSVVQIYKIEKYADGVCGNSYDDYYYDL